MSKSIDINEAEKEFHDAKSRLDALEIHVSSIANEIALLVHLQKNIEENISVLKSRQIITIAVEYKKAKDDLDKIYNKMSMLKINKNNLGHSIEQAKKFLVERRENYLLALENKSPKVIEVDFGRKDDRQDGDPA